MTTEEKLQFILNQPDQPIQHKEITVRSTRTFAKKMNEMLQATGEVTSKKNINLVSLKGSVDKVYNAIKFNKSINF